MKTPLFADVLQEAYTHSEDGIITLPSLKSALTSVLFRRVPVIDDNMRSIEIQGSRDSWISGLVSAILKNIPETELTKIHERIKKSRSADDEQDTLIEQAITETVYALEGKERGDTGGCLVLTQVQLAVARLLSEPASN